MTCKKCNGEGVIEKDSKMYECECSFIRRLALSMPPYIRISKVLKGHLKSPLIDLFEKSLFVISRWVDMRSIIKIVMIKHHNKLTRITSDRELRDIFVGGQSKSSKGDEDDGPVFNSLQDFLDLPDLVVVKLNELKYKNKAAPGLLEEALIYRLDREKPTWVLSDPTDPFGTSSHAYSQSVWELIMSSYQRIEVQQIHSNYMMPEPNPERVIIRESSLSIEESIPENPKQSQMGSGKETKKKHKKVYKPDEDDDNSVNGLSGVFGSGKK